jgi:hypothetical protein
MQAISFAAFKARGAWWNTNPNRTLSLESLDLEEMDLSAYSIEYQVNMCFHHCQYHDIASLATIGQMHLFPLAHTMAEKQDPPSKKNFHSTNCNSSSQKGPFNG